MPLHSTYHGCPNWTTAGCVCHTGHALPDYDTLAAELAHLTAENAALRADAEAKRQIIKRLIAERDARYG